MVSAVLCMLRYRLILYSAVNRVHVVLSLFNVRLLYFVQDFIMWVWLYVFLGCTRACVCIYVMVM